MNTVPRSSNGPPCLDLHPYSPELTEPGTRDTHATARAAGPAVRSARRGGFRVLTRFDDVRAGQPAADTQEATP